MSHPDSRQWTGFAVTFAVVAAAVLVLIIAAAYAADPYDTGRSTLLAKPGVRPQGPRTAAASRGRDPAFDALIIGNSHIQLLSPERLKKSTGIDFVQLSAPATGPKEQLTILDWFLRNRQRPPKAIVIGADTRWCGGDPTLANDEPFPFWLFADNRLEYTRGLLRFDILGELVRRLSYVVDSRPERARPDGYWDYEPNYLAMSDKTKADMRQGLAKKPHENSPRLDRDPQEGRRSFPAAERLRKVVENLPDETAVIVVFPPNYINALPPPETEAAYRTAACKAALGEAVGRHSRSALVDWRTQRPPNGDPALFFDVSHYRQPLARLIEADIAKALADLK